MTSYPGLMSAVGAAVTWGLVYTIDQRILGSTSPLVLLLLNSLLTSLVMLPLLLIEHMRTAILSVPTTILPLIVISVVLAAVANAFIFFGIRLLGASTASIFEIAYPVFVILFSFILFGTRPSFHLLIGAALVLVGSAIIVGKGL